MKRIALLLLMGYVPEDEGTAGGMLTDARGHTYEFYVDHRLKTKTPGAFYLNAYPADRRSVLVKNQD